MQPDTITLAVDEGNTGTTTDHAYNMYDRYNTRSIYLGPDHSDALRNMMTLYRTAPKSNGNFRGVRKSAAKFTCDISVLGVDGVSEIVSPMLLEIAASLPVGHTDAQSLLLRQKGVALLDLDAVIGQLLNIGEI